MTDPAPLAGDAPELEPIQPTVQALREKIEQDPTRPAVLEALDLLERDGERVNALRVRGFPFAAEIAAFIDAMRAAVLAKLGGIDSLDEVGLTPAPEADRLTLARICQDARTSTAQSSCRPPPRTQLSISSAITALINCTGRISMGTTFSYCPVIT